MSRRRENRAAVPGGFKWFDHYMEDSSEFILGCRHCWKSDAHWEHSKISQERYCMHNSWTWSSACTMMQISNGFSKLPRILQTRTSITVLVLVGQNVLSRALGPVMTGVFVRKQFAGRYSLWFPFVVKSDFTFCLHYYLDLFRGVRFEKYGEFWIALGPVITDRRPCIITFSLALQQSFNTGDDVCR